MLHGGLCVWLSVSMAISMHASLCAWLFMHMVWWLFCMAVFVHCCMCSLMCVYMCGVSVCMVVCVHYHLCIWCGGCWCAWQFMYMTVCVSVSYVSGPMLYSKCTESVMMQTSTVLDLPLCHSCFLPRDTTG